MIHWLNSIQHGYKDPCPLIRQWMADDLDSQWTNYVKDGEQKAMYVFARYVQKFKRLEGSSKCCACETRSI